MKQKIKLWAWRTLLSLTCLITASTAWADVTIYVNTADNNAPALYIFGADGGSATVDGVNYGEDPKLLTKSKTIAGKTWWYETFTGMNSCNAIFTKANESWENQTNDITSVSGTKFYTYDSSKDKYNNNCAEVTDNYSKYLDTYYATGNNATVSLAQHGRPLLRRWLMITTALGPGLLKSLAWRKMSR